MKIRALKIIAAAFALTLATFALFSCEDEATEPLSEVFRLDFDTGSCWQYELIPIDSNGVERADKKENVSFLAIKKEKIGGQIELSLSRTTKSFSDTVKVKIAGNDIFFETDSSFALIPNLPKTWFKFAKLDAKAGETWLIYSKIDDDFLYNFEGVDYLANYRIAVNGKLVAEDSIEIDGEKVFVKKFENKYDSEISFTKIDKVQTGPGEYRFDTLRVQKFTKRYENIAIAEDIGAVEFERLPFSEKIKVSPSSALSKTIKRGGFLAKLIKNLIKR